MLRFLRLSILPLLLVLAAAPVAWGQEEKALYKLGLILPDKDKRHDRDVLNAATDAFVTAKRFTVVERKELDAVFTEKDLQEFIGGQVNNKLSDVLGLDLLGVVGYTVETTPDSKGKPVKSWIIDVRLVAVKTASVLATITSNRPNILTPLTPREAGDRLLKSIREAFPPLGVIVQIEGKKVVIDLGSEAGVKKGDSLEIVSQGEEIIHPVTGELLPAPLSVVGQLKVVSTSHRLSTCKLKKPKKEIALADLVRLKGRDTLIVKWLLLLPRIKKELEEKRKALQDSEKGE